MSLMNTPKQHKLKQCHSSPNKNETFVPNCPFPNLVNVIKNQKEANLADFGDLAVG